MKKLFMILLCAPGLSWAAPAQPNIAPAVSAIYDHVILANAKQSVASCQAMQEALDPLVENASNKEVLPAFKQLVGDWKKVQATYVAGEVNEDFLDTPSAIDIFHNGNEDIHEQMARALASGDAPEKALFKYSQRTLTALESLLFSDEQISAREKQFAQYVTTSICKSLQGIEHAYGEGRDEFIQDTDRALAYYAHSMATSIFATKDWRLGDPAGLTRKYKDKPDYKRSEFALSGLNYYALQQIFTAQQEMMAPQTYANMVQIMQAYGAEKLSQDISANLNEMQSKLKALPDDTALFQKEVIQGVYALSNELYKQYYISLISALPVVAKVLDADGD